MDRTIELRAFSDSLQIHEENDTKHRIFRIIPHAASPFSIQANNLHRQIAAFEKILWRSYDSYVNYHKYVPFSMLADKESCFNETERRKFDNEIMTFISSAASEIQELNRLLEAIIHNGDAVESSLHVTHYKQMISDLLHQLGEFTSHSDKMQKEYHRNNISPCRLFMGSYQDIAATADIIMATDSIASDTAPVTGSVTEHPSESINQKIEMKENDFAQRYVDEIAPAAQMKEYDKVASNQKESLLKESKILCVQFSNDMKESLQMQRTVSDISSLLTNFANLIESQSGVVDFMGEASVDVKESVKQTDEELQLTVERTESHQYSMIAFIIGLSILLLLLDLLTP